MTRAAAVGNHSRSPRRKTELASCNFVGLSKNGRHTVLADKKMIDEYIRDPFQNSTDSDFRKPACHEGLTVSEEPYVAPGAKVCMNTQMKLMMARHPRTPVR